MGIKCSNKAATVVILVNLMIFSCVSSDKLPAACPPPSPRVPSSPPAVVPKKEVKCPKDTLKFGVCGSWLGLVHEVVGSKPSKECCTLINGIADLEAAICLCTAIMANVIGVVNIPVPVAISLLLSACGKQVPQGFKCP